MKKNIILFICTLLIACTNSAKTQQTANSLTNQIQKETKNEEPQVVQKEEPEKDKNLKNSDETNETEKEPIYKLKISNPLKLVQETGLPQPKYKISDEDYKKHADIMNYLYKYPNKSEKELFKELESVYNESAESLDAFIRDTMQAAVDRDLGKTVNETKINSKTLYTTNEHFLQNILMLSDEEKTILALIAK